MAWLMILCIALASCGALAEDQEANAANVYVKVLGQSGKIMIGRTENPAEDENRITVEMDSLYEVDASGNTVGSTGSTKHSFNSFANQDFSFSPLIDGKLEEVPVKKFSFDATLKDLSSNMKTTVYIFKEDGNFTYANEEQKVYAGQVKFSVELTDWEFCTPDTCTKGSGETGEYLDYTITLKGKGSASKRSSDKEEDELESYDFDVGSFRVSDQVQVDDQWQDMISGYPKMEVQGSKQKFTFRFPKFSNQVFYDPTIDSGCGFIHVSMVTFLLVALVTLFSA